MPVMGLVGALGMQPWVSQVPLTGSRAAADLPQLLAKAVWIVLTES